MAKNSEFLFDIARAGPTPANVIVVVAWSLMLNFDDRMGKAAKTGFVEKKHK